MLRKFIWIYLIILLAMLLVGLFQFLATTDSIPLGQALDNIRARLGIFLLVVFGGSAVAALVMLFFQELLSRFQNK
jgi:uncharacterized membrane protein YbhN (UPF0104 family)